MRKLLFVIISLAMVANFAFAGTSFYGSARAGLWYTNTDEDFNLANSGIEETRLMLDYYMQSNSRFGAKYTGDKMMANVEFAAHSGGVGLRHMYCEYDFGNMKLLVGQTWTGFAEFAAQAYDEGKGLMGYGIVYDGRQPQIRLTMNNGLYFTLLPPNKTEPIGQTVDALIPKIHIGFKGEIAGMTINFSNGFNMVSYNEDFGAATDESVTSFITMLTGKMNAGPAKVMFQGSFGQNTRNMGFRQTTTDNACQWNWADNKPENTTTMSFMGQVAYPLNENTTVTLGGGYVASDNENYGDPDAAMSVFAQASVELVKGFYLVPEVGLIDDMDTAAGAAEGSKMYFGTKLHWNFGFPIE